MVAIRPKNKPSARMEGKTTLFVYMNKQILRLRRNGQYRTAETYQTTLNSFVRFRKGVDVCWEEFDTDLLLEYEYWLKKKALVPNTVSFYMRRLRAAYNKAVEEGLTEDFRPFKRVFTSVERTMKRAVPLKYIKRLKGLDLSESPSLKFARDMFLFSFYTRGMSFIDIAYLQKKNLKGDVLTYRRRKTGQLLSVRWEACMNKIVSAYSAPSDSPYLFSIVEYPRGDVRMQYHNALTRINRHLKTLGKTIELPVPLTMYVARHSWASIARGEGIPVSVISEGMGHDSESTTRIYLASLETRVIDRANQKILKLL